MATSVPKSVNYLRIILLSYIVFISNPKYRIQVNLIGIVDVPGEMYFGHLSMSAVLGPVDGERVRIKYVATVDRAVGV